MGGGGGARVQLSILQTLHVLLEALLHYIHKYRPNNDHNYLFLTNDGNAIL